MSARPSTAANACDRACALYLGIATFIFDRCSVCGSSVWAEIIKPCAGLRCAIVYAYTGEHRMAKGNRETKKPKKVVAKTIVAAESIKGGGPKMMPTLGATKKR